MTKDLVPSTILYIKFYALIVTLVFAGGTKLSLESVCIDFSNVLICGHRYHRLGVYL